VTLDVSIATSDHTTRRMPLVSVALEQLADLQYCNRRIGGMLTMKGQMVYVLIVILGVNWSQQLRVRIQGGKSTTDFMWIRATIC
jgi:hypothetical protein